MRRTKEEIKQMVDMVRKANTAGWVCDAVQECDGWSAIWANRALNEVIIFFEFCPFCGKKLDWENWERLK